MRSTFNTIQRTGFTDVVEELATPVQAVTVEHALHQAGLDWEVAKEQIVHQTPNGEIVEVPNRFHTVRTDLAESDPDRFLGVVKSSYEVVQNVEAFAFLNSIARSGVVELSAAGTFTHSRVFMQIKLPDIEVLDGDKFGRYMLAFTGHEANAVRIIPMATRFFCMNQFHAGIRNATLISVVHSASAHTQLDIATKLLRKSNDVYEHFASQMRRLASKSLGRTDIKGFLETLLPSRAIDKKTNKPIISTRVQNMRERIEARLIRSPNLDGHRKDYYGLVNAVIEYVDHDRIANGSVKSEKRLENLFIGTGATLTRSAMELALAA